MTGELPTPFSSFLSWRILSSRVFHLSESLNGISVSVQFLSDETENGLDQTEGFECVC